MPPQISPTQEGEVCPPPSSEDEKIEEFINSWLKEAPYIDGNPEGPVLPKDIPWFDPILAEKGKEFVESNFFLLVAITMLDIFMGLANKPISVLSYCTYYPNGCAGVRYISTAKTMMDWFLSPDWDHNSQFFRQVEKVRKLHKLYARPKTPPQVPHPNLTYPKEYKEIIQAVRKDLEKIDTSRFPTDVKTWSPPLLFSQHELAFVVYASVSSLYLYHHKLGISKGYEENEGLKGYVHLWAVVGRMLGLEDRFNAALFPSRKLYHKMIQEFGFGILKGVDESVIFMFEESTKILGKHIPFVLTTKALLYQVLEISDVEAPAIWKSMSLYDKIVYYVDKSIIFLYCNVSFMKVIIDFVTRKGFHYFTEKYQPSGSYR